MTDLTDRRFVSIHAPPILQIRTRTILAQDDEELEDVPLESTDLDFTFRSEDGRVRFKLHLLPNWLEGDTLTALVLDVVVHHGDGTETDFQPETDTFVNILVEEDESGNTNASLPASELPFLTLE